MSRAAANSRVRWMDAALVIGAALLLAWSVLDARSAALPPIPARGAPLTTPVAPASDREGDATPNEVEIEGAGTRSSPARLPLHLFAFDDYDPVSLRVDKTPLAADAFPDPIQRFHDTYVVIEGYTLAVDVGPESVTGLILSRYPPGCCFGAMPVLDEWIDVTIGADADPDRSWLPGAREARVFGRLEIGETVDEDGRVESLYRVAADRLEPLR